VGSVCAGGEEAEQAEEQSQRRGGEPHVSRRVAPGTRLQQVADVLHRITACSGRGATVVEIREAYGRAHGSLAPAGIDAALRRLEAAGTIRKVGGRHRRTQWAHVNHPVPFSDPDDVAPVIAEIVTALTTKLGRPIETHEVATEMERRGAHALSNDQIRTRLESLARGSTRKAERTVAEWAEPKVKRITGRTRGGRQTVSWAALDQHPVVHGFKDARDAVRYAVGRVAEVLGRPASRREIQLWALALSDRAIGGDHHHLDDPAEVGVADQDHDRRDHHGDDDHDRAVLDRAAVAVVRSPRFRQILSGIAGSDEERDEQGRVRTVRTSLSSRGIYPARFAVTGVTQTAELACALTDLGILLRPISEMEGIDRLQAEAEETGSRLLLEIADARRIALRSPFDRGAPISDADRETVLAEAVSLANRALETVAGWARRAGLRKEIVALERSEIAGFLTLPSSAATPGTGAAEIITVDQSPGTRLEDIEPLALEALELGDRQVQYWSPLVIEARRLRGPLRGGISCDDPSETESILDRVDGIMSIARTCHLPAMGALLGRAVDLLGHVIRDPEIIRRWIDQARHADVEVWQALVVALGMLGAPLAVAEAWPDPHDPDQAIAYFAAIAVGVDGLDQRVALAEAADRWAQGGAALQISEVSIARIEAGCRLSAVD
jgi:hypothetical protein